MIQMMPRGKLVTAFSLLLICIFIFLRTTKLSEVPAGFYIDEAGEAASILCIAESGSSFYHEHLPLYATGPGGGKLSPVYVYLGALWTKINGPTVESLRMLVAMWNLVGLVGLFYLTRLFGGATAGWVAVIAALMCPWAIISARVAWDPSLGTAPLIWGTYFMMRAQRTRDWCLAALVLTLATYCYQAMRVQVVLLCIPVLIYARRQNRLSLKQFTLFCSLAVGAALPQILFVLSPEGQGRFQTVSIFTKNYLENEANGSVGTLLLIFGKNILAHLSPRFLFWSGDSNLRHSLATFGQLGYLEFFALMLGLPAWAWKRWRSLRPGVALAVLGILSGVIPAAMTWDSLPHALRSMGVWPFFAVLTGLLWAKLSETWPRLAVIFFIIVAGGFTIRFVPTFYHEVKDASRSWFDFELVLAAAKATSEEEWDVALKAYPNYARDAWAFHLMSIKGLTCDEARMRIEKIIGK